MVLDKELVYNNTSLPRPTLYLVGLHGRLPLIH